MKTSIVLGLQYGDEGKGSTTSFLSKKNDLVVRFNGGHQAGHTVVTNGQRHIFSSFGSGTLNGAHTYISEYCTFYPKSFLNERAALNKLGIEPQHFIHPMAMVTTPFDIDHNRKTERINEHGSVGMGFGATIARNQDTPYKLYAIDLTHKRLLVHKLRNIANYYQVKSDEAGDQIFSFLNYVDQLKLIICRLDVIAQAYSNIIFEGAQGIMLDMDFGFFPNVTRSNTTSKNAMQIIKENGLPAPEVYYAMRSYLTRHGNGVMPNEDYTLTFPDETNVSNKYQGKFRQGWHSAQQIRYALDCDYTFSGYYGDVKNLSISCMDQTDGKILIDMERVIPKELWSLIGEFNNVITNWSPSTETMKMNDDANQ